MPDSQHIPPAPPRSVRIGIAIGFAVIATAAVMSHARAASHAADQPTNNNPAERVAADKR